MELLYHIADFQCIFIREAHQCPKRIERSIVMDELHIEFRIPFRQRATILNISKHSTHLFTVDTKGFTPTVHSQDGRALLEVEPQGIPLSK